MNKSGKKNLRKDSHHEREKKKNSGNSKNQLFCNWHIRKVYWHQTHLHRNCVLGATAILTKGAQISDRSPFSTVFPQPMTSPFKPVKFSVPFHKQIGALKSFHFTGLERRSTARSFWNKHNNIVFAMEINGANIALHKCSWKLLMVPVLCSAKTIGQKRRI